VVTSVCAKCGSRLRAGDAWCSLCLTPRSDARSAPRDDAAEPAPSAPVPSAPVPPGLLEPEPPDARRAEAVAAADRLITQLAISESADRRTSRLGRFQAGVAERSGLTPGGAGALIAVAGGVALLLGLIVVLTVLGLLL
jgi:hypothetical protein